ncbi:MAG: right-handed parallel beta-helix repeat-containing protein [Myxococcales bacterium]|nr:right-handed parallel beta-helix repeat-containing protein [Myxococcales bacterium]
MRFWVACVLLVLASCSPAEDDDEPEAPEAAVVDAEPDAELPDAAPDAELPDAVPVSGFALYLAVDGDDGAEGRTPATALATMAGVHERLWAAMPDDDVQVRIGPGRYHQQTVEWSWTHPVHAVSFFPDVPETRPVFDGCDATGTQCPGGVWLNVEAARGEPTNVNVEGLRFENYQGGVSLHGDRLRPDDGWNGANRVEDCEFYNIGNVFDVSVGNAFGAINLTNSRNNLFAGNRFVRTLVYAEFGLMHAIYVAHDSTGNLIEENHFEIVSGDAVRFRDASSDNLVRRNVFIKAGTAGYTDWYCEHDTRDDCTKPTPECPSWNNRFEENVLEGTWPRCNPLPAVLIYQDDVETGCEAPEDAERVAEVDNVEREEGNCMPGVDPAMAPPP